MLVYKTAFAPSAIFSVTTLASKLGNYLGMSSLIFRLPPSGSKLVYEKKVLSLSLMVS